MNPSSSITSAPSPIPSPTLSHMLSPLVNGVRQGAEQQPSAVVNLSAQAQSLNQAAQSDQATQINQQTPSGSKEITAAPGIQFITGEGMGGKINTFA
ncbi:MAG TPA: hypothetical protein VFW53_06395 [Gallionella sp.]|nr:hypothetical protein [Gallionella sp.]